MDILNELLSMEQLKELEKTKDKKTFVKIVKLQQDVCKNEVEEKNKELKKLRDTLTYLKSFTQTGPREKVKK